MSKYIAESIKQLIAGRFNHVRLRELHKKQFLYTVEEGLHGWNVLQSVVWLIDSATYLVIKIDSLYIYIYMYVECEHETKQDTLQLKRI